jgi:small GTP-binding protein
MQVGIFLNINCQYYLGVGKSCLTVQATQNKFDDSYATTVGFEFFGLNYKVDNKIIRLQIWDTCGQEIYRSLVSNFYRSSSLAFLVYSIDK